MRRSILYYFALLAFTCVSCYEGEDLVETYNQYNATFTFLFIKSTSSTL